MLVLWAPGKVPMKPQYIQGNSPTKGGWLSRFTPLSEEVGTPHITTSTARVGEKEKFVTTSPGLTPRVT